MNTCTGRRKVWLFLLLSDDGEQQLLDAAAGIVFANPAAPSHSLALTCMRVIDRVDHFLITFAGNIEK